MAGLDYSKVVEPAFDPVKYKQSQNVTAYIDDLIAKWKVQWANRHKMAEEERTGMGDIWSNRYNVYYDETGVQEERLEKVRMYENKVGWHSVLSHGQYGPYGPQSVYAMFIPWQADEGTRQDAITEAKRAKAEGGASRYVVVDPLGDGQYEV